MFDLGKTIRPIGNKVMVWVCRVAAAVTGYGLARPAAHYVSCPADCQFGGGGGGGGGGGYEGAERGAETKTDTGLAVVPEPNRRSLPIITES